MSRLSVRGARAGEASALSELCVRSKAVWGYDAAFMALCEAALTITPAQIDAGDVWVAEDGAGVVHGVAALCAGDGPGAFEVDKLFIAPSRLNAGTGRLLMARLTEEARRRGGNRLTILSDPNAAGFYERMGARRIGEAPSDAVPGRSLPLYVVRL